MKTFSLYWVMIILISNLSCKSENIKEIEVKEEINIEEGEKIQLSKLIDSFTYITLEDKELIGKIYKLKVTDDSFYIHDNLGKSLLKYSHSGEFVYKISKHGRGPGEYIRITDFIIDNAGGVQILNVGSHKRLWFDEKGNYLKETEIKSMDFNHSYLNDSTIISYHHPGMKLKSKYAFHVWDHHLNTLMNEDIKFEKYKDKFLNGSLYPFSKYQNTINFCGDFSNIIYSINKLGAAQPKYRLNFNYYEWPPEKMYKEFYNTNPFMFMKGMEPYVHFLNFIEDSRVACISFYVKKDKYHAFYNKSDKDVICASEFVDDIGLGTTNFNIVAQQDGFWYAIVETFEMDNLQDLKKQGIKVSDNTSFLILKFKLL